MAAVLCETWLFGGDRELAAELTSATVDHASCSSSALPGVIKLPIHNVPSSSFLACY